MILPLKSELREEVRINTRNNKINKIAITKTHAINKIIIRYQDTL